VIATGAFAAASGLGFGDAGLAATQRRTRLAHGAGSATGASGGSGASHCAVVSTCLASASSIHRNGIGFRIGFLPGAVFDPRAGMVAKPPDGCL
jgi:hypothetical protein